MYGSIGKLAITQREMATNQAIAFAVPDPTVVDAKYLFYYLMSQRAWLVRAGKGATQQNISQTVLRAWPVPVPSLGDQRHIVEVLEDQLSRLDAGDSYLRRVMDKKALARGAVFQSAITPTAASEPGDVCALATERGRRIPAGMKRGRPRPVAAAEVDVPWGGRWPTVSLEEATDPVRTISYGILKPGPDFAGGVPYVRVLNMRDDRLAVDDLRFTTPEIAQQYSRASLEPGDLLVSIRGTYGRVVSVPSELGGANITQDTARLAILPPLLPTFVAMVLRSPFAQAYMKRVARGVGVKGVNIADLRRLPIPVPSTAEQVRLSARVEALVSDVEAATSSAAAALRRATQLRRGVLLAAFGDHDGGRSQRASRSEEPASV